MRALPDLGQSIDVAIVSRANDPDNPILNQFVEYLPVEEPPHDPRHDPNAERNNRIGSKSVPMQPARAGTVVLHQIGPAIGFYSHCRPAISSGSCRSLNTLPADAAKS
jgi:hypothetical protein